MKRAIYLFLAACTAAFSLPAALHAQGSLGLTTVVIDPGHGGTDPGAVSRDGKYYEKTFTLDISRKLRDKIREAYPEVKVVLTRDSDKTLALNDRAAIANKADADLFISIHINAAPKTGPNGYSVHVLGQSSKKNRDLFAYNMDVCKRENSVILLEDDYTTKYQGFDPSDPESFIFMQLMQNSHLEQSLGFAQFVSECMTKGPVAANRGIWQDPFLVLWKTAMPAVLVECGFISNASDLGVLKNSSDRDRIAACLFNAFKQYKSGYDMSVALDVEVEPAGGGKASVGNNGDGAKAGGEQSVAAGGDAQSSSSAPDVRYGVQIFAGSKRLPDSDRAFLGYKPLCVKAGKLYKYIIGISGSPAGAKSELPKIRKTYPDAFLVKLQGETVSVYK